MLVWTFRSCAVFHFLVLTGFWAHSFAGANESFFKYAEPPMVAEGLESLRFYEIDHAGTGGDSLAKSGVCYISDEFVPGSRFGIWILNTLSLRQFKLELQPVSSPESGIELLIRSSPLITEWTWLSWKVPKEWHEVPCRFVISRVRSLQATTVFGFSEPVPSIESSPSGKREFSRLAVAVALTGFYGLLILIPGVWIILELSLCFKVKKVLIFPLVVLGGSAVAYIGFWIALLQTSLFFLVIVGIYLVAVLRTARHRELIKNCIFENPFFRDAVVLWIFSSLLSTAAGFMYGGWDNPILTAQNRYLASPFPYDNMIPFAFAERVFHDHSLNPFFLGWLSSDRPPLQTAWVLLVTPWFYEPDLGYHLVSSLLQSLAIPGVYLLGVVSGTRRQAWILSVFGVFTSTFVLNSFYVWPKLLPVFYGFFTFCILLYPKVFFHRPDHWFRPFLVASGIAFAMLTHGSSLFSIIGIGLVAFFSRCMKWKSWVWCVVFVLLWMLPWVYYQKCIDPPGNRLLFWHLAGFHGEPQKGLLATIVSQYSNIGWSVWVQNKIENLNVIAGSWGIAFRHMFPLQWSNHFHLLRSGMFLSLGLAVFPMIPLLILTPFLWFKREAGATKRFLGFHWSIFVITLLVWVLLIFSPGRTILHQGSYIMVFQVVVLCVVPLLRISSFLSSLYLVLNAAIITIIWVFPGPAMQQHGRWIINENTPDLACWVSYLVIGVFLVFPGMFSRGIGARGWDEKGAIGKVP